jgi:phenylpropionate dioxygenase-like ring-hydroxylating dioxygenase large terminal subunit
MSGGEWPAGLLSGWHPIAYADEIGARPVPLTLMDRPFVAFRSNGTIALLEDRCPHRNAPLSQGRVVGHTIECPYHGWRFDASGACTRIAGTDAVPDARAISLPVKLHDGLVWTSLAAEPVPPPNLPPEVTDPAFDSFWWRLSASRGAIGDAIENLVDPVHAYFLHPGLVRRATAPRPVDVELTIALGLCTARYTEPPESLTWLQRLTEGRRVASWGRYWPPAIVQIAFADAHGFAATITVVFAPVGRLTTRPYACFSTRRGLLPAWLKRAFIIAFHRRVLDQDLAMLRAQADVHEHFGGRDYCNGPLDLFGPSIWAGLNGRPLTPQHRTLRLTGRA